MRDLDRGWNAALKAAAQMVCDLAPADIILAKGLNAIAVNILTLIRNEDASDVWAPPLHLRRCFERMVIQVPSHQPVRLEGHALPAVMPDVLLMYDTHGISLHEDKPWWQFPQEVKVGQGGIMRIKVDAPRLITKGELYIGTTKE